MTRRRFVAVSAVLALPRAGEAQQTGKVARIGFLGSSIHNPRTDALLAGLRDFGYVDGHTVIVEWRASEGRPERLRDLAVELARLRVDVIVAPDNPSIAAAQKATGTIPIVMILASDPVESGFVSSLANPGGNTTGLTSQATEFQGKALQLLKEAVPNLSRVAILWNPAESGRRAIAQEAETAARALRLHVDLATATNLAELESFFTTVARRPASAVLVQPSQVNFTYRSRITELSKKRFVPTIGWSAETAEAGWLMSYGPNIIDLYRRAGYFVDKVLKGFKPAELPIERPTTFELVINLRAAKALGITIPASVLLQADRVIQ
jgi:putative ABC transport system substrate-binding protein